MGLESVIRSVTTAVKESPKLLLASASIFLTLELNAQDKLEPTKADIDSIINSSWSISSLQPEKTIHKLDSAITLSEMINYDKGLADAHKDLGFIYYSQGNYERAKHNYLKQIKLSQQLGDTLSALDAKFNLGMVFEGQAMTTQAIDIFTETLENYKQRKDTFGITYANTQLGNVFLKKGSDEDIIQAKEYYFQNRALIKSPVKKIENLINIGVVYELQDSLVKSRTNYEKALELAEKTDNNQKKALALNNIGVIHKKEGNYDEAITFFNQALAIDKKIDSYKGLVDRLTNISEIHTKLGNSDSALSYLHKAHRIADSLNNNSQLLPIIENLYTYHKSKEDYKKSLEYIEQYHLIKESIKTQETNQKLNALRTRLETEKKEERITLLEEKDQIQQEKLKIKNYLIGGGAGALVLITGLFAYSYRENSKKKKANEELSYKNFIIERQNKEYQDNLKNASRLQEILLPSKKIIDKTIGKHFVFYRPKDRVSGDFYFVGKKDRYNYFAAIDCTGHGVSGAFMSGISNTLIYQSIYKNDIIYPDSILENVRNNLIKELGADKDNNMRLRDGFDGTICMYEDGTDTLYFASAKNPVYHVRNGSLKKYKGDYAHVGYDENPKPFTRQSLNIFKEDMVYLSSDGFKDQFGGQDDKKFMEKRLQHIFLSIHDRPMRYQEEYLKLAMNNWMGTTEQIDDMLIFGKRF
ncbi:MAG: tetratricopeptide repeat protein [Nanobdellota archaeon]